MQRVQISGGLFACIMAISIQVAQALFVAAPLAKYCGQDAWLASLVGGGVGMLNGLLAVWISTRHPGQGPAQIARNLLGNWVGGLVGLVYAGLLAFLLTLAMRYVLDFTFVILLPGTPGRVIASLFGAVVLFGAWSGLEPTARVSFQVLMGILFTVGLLPLLQVRELSLLQVDPVLYHGIGSLLQGAVYTLPWFGQTLVAMSLVSFMKHPREAYRWLVVGVTTGMLLIAGVVALTVFVIGPDLPSRIVFPLYSVVQMVSIARIIERIEVVVVTVWTSGMWVKASFYLFAASEAAAWSLGLKDHRRVMVVIAVGGVLLTQIWGSPLDVMGWERTPGFIVTFAALEYGLPILLAAATLLRPRLLRRVHTHA